MSDVTAVPEVPTADAIVSMTDVSNVGAMIAKSKYRGIIYLAMGLLALALTVANGVYAYLWAAHAIGSFPIWLGAVGVAFPIVSGAVHGLSKANTP